MENMSMDEIVSGITSTDQKVQVEAIQTAIELFGNNDDIIQQVSTINSLIEANCLPILIEILCTADNNTNNQELIAWSVSLLHKISCFGNDGHIKLLTDSKIIPPLIALLRSSNKDIVCNTLKALGNIALDTSEQRDLVINEGAIQPILDFVKPSSSDTLLELVAWFLYALCYCNNSTHALPLDMLVVNDIMPTLNHLLHYNDDDILSKTCHALYDLTYREPIQYIEAVMNTTGIIQRIVELLTIACNRTDNPKWLKTSINMLHNMSWEIVKHPKALIEAGVLPPLFALLKLPQTEEAHSATDTLLNICSEGIGGIEIRDHVFIEEAIAPIVQIELPNLNRKNLFRPVAEVVLSLIENHKPRLGTCMLVLNQLLSGLNYLIKIDDQENYGHLFNTCWAFKILIKQSAGPKEIQLILDFDVGLLPRIIQLLDHGLTASAALRTIMAVTASGNEHQKSTVLAAGVLPVLAKLLNNHEQQGFVEREAIILVCLLTSSILKTRATAQIDSLFSNQVVDALLNVLANGYTFLQTNAAKAITNIARDCEQEHIVQLREMGAFVPMFAFLQETGNIQTILTLLNGLTTLLRGMDRDEFFSFLFSLRINFRLIKLRIETLAVHQNAKIRCKSSLLLKLLHFVELLRL